MKVITKKKMRTVQATSASEFDRQFNAVSEELPSSAELKWDTAPMCVHFIYEEEKEIPETVADEFDLQGIHYYCKDCPYLNKGQNKRQRSHGCKYAEFGTVTDFTPACEFFLKKVLNGEIEPEVD